MRKLSGALAVGALVLAGATASAAPVSTTAILTVDLGALGAFSVTGAGSVSLVGSGGNIAGGDVTDATRILVPSGLVALDTAITIHLDPNDTTLVTKIVLNTGVGQGAGTFVSNFDPGDQACPQGDACVVGGGKGGVMPLTGEITPFVDLGGGGVGAPVDLGNLNIGAGGMFTDQLLGILPITGSGAPWTTGSAQVVSNPEAGLVATANGSGADPIRFVSPTFLNAVGNAVPIVTRFSLRGISMGTGAVPEPGTLLLLGSGIAGLVFAGWRSRS